MADENAYAEMQKTKYEGKAQRWRVDGEHRNAVTGGFNEHNNWKDYELLHQGIDTKDLIMLDFGCGPGRNIVKYWKDFKRVDGVDVGSRNIENAKTWIEYNDLSVSDTNLYVNNGLDLSGIESETYDAVMSTIAIQHICVHTIRYNLFKEFYRVLKPGGYITIQMGYWGDNPDYRVMRCKMCRLAKKEDVCTHPTIVDYHENYYGAPNTNGAHDTKVSDPSELEKDLTEMQFKNFEHSITRTGPWDQRHPNWIFFRAWK